MIAAGLSLRTVLCRPWLGLLVGLMIAMDVSAHRGHGMWTEVAWAGNGFEITHRIHLSDALRVLENMEAEASIESMEGLALLALYVEANFRVSSVTERAELSTLGAEIDDDFLYVFQEWLTPLPAQTPTFSSSVLLDIEPSAHAYVNYQAPGINETLQLETGALHPQRHQLPAEESLLAL